MENLLNRFRNTSVLLLLLCVAVISTAQQQVSPTAPKTQSGYQLAIQNVIQVSDSIFEFDIDLLDTDATQDFELASVQVGVLLNSSICSGGTLTASIVSGTSTLNASQVPASISIINTLSGYPGQSLIKTASKVPPGANNGTIIAKTGNGNCITRIRVVGSVPFDSDSTANMVFIADTVHNPLYATRVAQYISGINTQHTVTPAVNALVLENPLLNPFIPAAYNVTGNGSYCQGAIGIEIGLNGSESNVVYTLYKNGIAQVPTVSGTGSAISFGLQLNGTYTVTGISNSGTNTYMIDTASVIELSMTTPSVSIATDNTNVCSGTSITLTASPVNGGTPSYQWYLNGIATGTNIDTFSHTPTNGDSVYVVMTSGLVCTTTNPVQSNSAKFIVNPVSVATVSITTDQTSVCSGATVTFTATPVNGGIPTYQWYKNGASIGSSNSTFSYVPMDGDKIYVEMTSSIACTSFNPTSSDTITMQVNPIQEPSVTITASNNSICSGTPASLTAMPGNGGAASYQWYVNGLMVGVDSSVYAFNPNHGDSVYVVMTSDLSCTTTNPVQSNKIGFSVADVVAASVTISADNTEVCSGTEVTLTATPVNGGVPSYQWYINGTASGTGTEVFSYIPSDGDQVKVVMASSLACTSNSPATSNTLAMQVTQIPSPAVSVTASSNPVCSGTEVTLTATPIDGGTPVYQWYLNGTAVGTGAGTYSYTPAEADEIYVSMTTSLGCSNGSPVQSNVNVIALTNSYVASVSITADNNPYCAGGQVKLTATPGNGGAASYQWFLNGSPVGLDTNIYVYSPTNGDEVYAESVSDLVCAIGNPAVSSILTLMETAVLPVSVSIAADNTSVCSGTQVNFTATPVNGGSSSYQWFVNGSAAGTDSPVFNYTPIDGDTVAVEMTSNMQCTSNNPALSNIQAVSVTQTLPVYVSMSADDTSVCSGTQVNFTATTVNGGTPIYQWFVNGTAAGTDSPTFSYIPVDGDKINISVLSNLTCTSGNPSLSDTISVNVGGVLPVSVSIAADDTSVCSGTGVTFTATPINGGNAGYQWFVNGTAAGADSPVFSYAPANGDIVSVEMTSDMVCAAGNPAVSNGIGMEVTGTLPVSVAIAADHTAVCNGAQVTFTATPTNGGATSCQWFVNNTEAGTDSPEFVYTPADGDMVHVVATSSLACTSGNPAHSDTIQVSVGEVMPVSVSISADNTAVCSGTEVNFTATPVNGGTPSYQWYVDGVAAGTDSPAFSYAPQDGDKVHVRLTSGIACTSGNPAQSDTIPVSVGEVLPVSVSIAADNTSVCSGTPVTFTATPVNGGSPSYQWSVNGSAIGSSSQNFIYTPINGDVVNVEMTSDLNCTTNNPALSNTIVPEVIELLPVSVTIDADTNMVCSGTEVTLVATPVNGGEPAYQWNVNGKLAGYNMTTYTYAPVDGDEVYVQMISSLSCTSNNPAQSNIETFTVSAPLNVAITLLANDTSVCDGTSVTLTTESINGGNAKYKWFVNGIATGSNLPEYTYVPVDGDEVEVELTSDLECTTQNPAMSNIVMLTVIENLPVSVNIETDSTSICQGALATVTATAVNAGNPVFQWYVNNFPEGTGNEVVSYNPSNGDQVKVKVTSDLVCTTNNPAESGIIEFYVEDYPNVTWEVGNDTVLCIGDNGFEITGAQPEGGIYSGAGVAGGIFDPLVAGVGTYEIVYTYATSLGCTNQASATFTVDSCTRVSSVKLENRVAVYPNPASDVLYVAINGGAAVKVVRLVSLLGNTVMEVKTAPDEKMVKLPLSGLSQAFYFVEIMFEEGMLIKQVVVK